MEKKEINYLPTRLTNSQTMKYYLLILTSLCIGLSGIAQELSNDSIVSIIKRQGLENSQVMDYASWMTDVCGPRLTGSPGLDNATTWVAKKMSDIGMTNVHLQEWGPFGRGWEMTHFELHMESPTYAPLIAYPKAWSPSATGTAEAIYLDAKTVDELDNYKGKLAGKIVLLDSIREVEEAFEPIAKRHDDASLLELANAKEPKPRSGRNRNRQGAELRSAIWNLLEAEKPLAVLDRSYKGDLGTVFVSGATTAEGSARDEGKYVVPQITVAVEHYNRIQRILEKGIPVKLNVDFKANYTNPDGMEHNIIAEIPGTDLKDEVVMFGGHFDSWHAGTGATDNASGSCVMLEAARILIETIKETGIKPRRTLRLALWTGEEQGLHGSRAYVKENFAYTDETGRNVTALKDAQKTVSAYYNYDNGTGGIRGIYLQGNQEVSPIFRSWLEPFEDLKASTISLSNTGGTDHLPFDAAGIPGFQFIQDPVAYSTKTHHSNMDNYDHLIADDLKRSATIIAYFIWQTSQRDEQLPRKANDFEYSKE